MKHLPIRYSILAVLTALLLAPPPIFAQTTSTDVTKIQTFIQSIIQILVTLSGLIAVLFFIWGGFRYITSSGNPQALDRSKSTIVYSAIGLAITLGAFILSNIITELATNAFGGM